VSEDGTALRLERTFEAPPEAVYDAWTNPEVLRRWWAAAPDWSTPHVEADVRVGGRYRLSMQDPEASEPHTVAGEYTEVRRPERLAYTWTWEGDPESQRGSAGSLVTVDFHDEGGGTRVVVTHTGFAGEHVRAQHEHGWNACLDNLARRVLAPAPGSRA
jgi:uncharacterized protein YndB with AHSA1/START domain